MKTIWDAVIRVPRVFRFVAVGITCTASQQLLLILLVKNGSGEYLANAVGFIISTQLNFLLSYHLTYGDRKGDSTRRLLQFNALAITVLVCNMVAFATALKFTPYLVAGFLGIVGTLTGAVINYLVGTKFIFTSHFIAEPESVRLPTSTQDA